MNNDLELSSIQSDIDESLENLKKEISQKLMSIGKTNSGDELAVQEALVTEDLKSGITKTRIRIDQNISKSRRKPKSKG